MRARFSRASVVGWLVTALAAAPSASAQIAPRVITSHFSQKQQQTERYVYVPFDVPSGVTRIDIDFKYQKTDENVIDLGLLEPGSLALGTNAFRGWSGGERTAIFVSASDATPGYWPGPIQAGTWRVGLGLYKVGAAGVDVEVRVKLSSEAIPPRPPALPARPKEPIRSGSAWYAGALHDHTHNSDGALSGHELATQARGEGLDFLALTDHNTTAQQREAADVPGLLTIIGEEVTTPGGHANVWGLGGARDFIDFRVLPGDTAIKTLFETAAAKGALMGINHPYGDCVACTWTHDIPAGASTIEITSRNSDEMQKAIAMWDFLLRQGRHITAIGVSDWHRGPAPIGVANVRVFASELSTRAILDSIRAGHVIVMTNLTAAPPDFRLSSGAQQARIGDTLSLASGDPYDLTIVVPPTDYKDAHVDLIWNGERVASAPLVDGIFHVGRFASTSGYLRAHVVNAQGMPVAITNPIWIKVSPR